MHLFQDLPDEREHEEREHRAPDKGVEDHDRPPDGTAARRAECIGHDEPRLAEETLKDEEQYEVQHTKRHVGEQERFHLIFLSLLLVVSLVICTLEISHLPPNSTRDSRGRNL